jgi:hypothetical protein
MTRDPMTLPWLVWVGLVLSSFLILEVTSIAWYGRPGTLTAHVQEWSAVHPLIPFGLGVAVGALAYHFWKTSV